MEDGHKLLNLVKEKKSSYFLRHDLRFVRDPDVIIRARQQFRAPFRLSSYSRPRVTLPFPTYSYRESVYFYRFTLLSMLILLEQDIVAAVAVQTIYLRENLSELSLVQTRTHKGRAYTIGHDIDLARQFSMNDN